MVKMEYETADERVQFENALKERIINLLKNTQYSLVFFEYYWGCFGNVDVIVKKNDSEYFRRFTKDRNDIDIGYQQGKKATKIVKKVGWRKNVDWSPIGPFPHEENDKNDKFYLLFKAIEKYTE